MYLGCKNLGKTDKNLANFQLRNVFWTENNYLCFQYENIYYICLLKRNPF